MTALYLERYLNYGLTLEELQFRQADHRHRADRLGPLALQPPSHRSGQARARRHPRRRRHRLRIPGASDPGNRQAPDRGARPQSRLSRPGRSALRLSARRRRADHRLRQDHAGLPDGGGDRQHSRPSCCRAGRCSTAGGRASAPAPAPSSGRRAQTHAAGEIDYAGVHRHRRLVGALDRPLQHHGHRLDDELRWPRRSACRCPAARQFPAPYRERAQIAYETGKRVVEMVREDLKPSDILTRKAFENAIVACSAIGGSTNAPIHINAIARHIGVKLDIEDWERIGYDVPLLVNMQPAGEYLGEEYYRAGGVAGGDARTVQGRQAATPTRSPSTARPWRERAQGRRRRTRDVIRPYAKPMKKQAGFKVLTGNLFDSRDHEDQRDLRRIPRSAICPTRRTRTPSKAAPSCSTARRIITAASTIPALDDRRQHACCSSAASGRSAIPARPRW